MPEIVNEPPVVSSARYSWTLWNDGQWRSFDRGTDFTTSPRQFVAAAYNWARRNNHRCEYKVDGLTDVVYLRLSPQNT